MAQDKKSAEAVKQEVAHLKQQIEVLKERARELGRAFASLDEDQLTKKVKGETSNSPFMFAQSWTSGAPPGSPAVYAFLFGIPIPTDISRSTPPYFSVSAISSASTRPGWAETGVGPNSHRIAYSSPQTRTTLSVSITQFPRGCRSEPITATR